MKQACTGPLLALALTLGAAGTITVSAGTVVAPQAHAFGLSDITGAVKDAGSRLAKDAKNSAKIVGGKLKDAGKVYGGDIKKAGKQIKQSAKLIGRKAKSSTEQFRRNLKGTGSDIKTGAIKARNGVAKAADYTGRGLRKVKRCVTSGDCGHKFTPPTIPPKKPTPPARPGQWSDTVASQGSALAIGQRAKRKVVGNDRSIYGRPVRGANRKVQGITRHDLQLNRKRNGNRITRDLPRQVSKDIRKNGKFAGKRKFSRDNNRRGFKRRSRRN